MNSKDLKEITQFAAIVIITLAITWFLHSQALAHYFQVEKHGLVKSYVFNVIFTISAYSLLVYLKENYASSIGFIFIATGFLKFIFFFVMFYPIYTLDNKISRIEFSEFFIPYLLCLGLEVYFLIKTVLKD